MTPRSVLVVGAGLAGARCAETLRAEGYDGDARARRRGAVRALRAAGALEGVPRGDADGGRACSLRPPIFWAEQRDRARARTAGDRGSTRRAPRDDRSRAALPLGRARPGDRSATATAAVRSARAACTSCERSRDALALRRRARARRAARHRRRRLRRRRGRLDRARARRRGDDARGGPDAVRTRCWAPAIGTLLGGPLPRARRRPAHGSAGGRLPGATARDECAGSSSRTESVVACDVVLVAVGVEPARELGAAGRDLRSSPAATPRAARGHWTSAAAEAVAAARRILGLDPLPAQPPFFWSDQFGLRLQLVGDTRTRPRSSSTAPRLGFVARYRAPGGRLVAALAANQPAAMGGLRLEVATAA